MMQTVNLITKCMKQCPRNTSFLQAFRYFTSDVSPELEKRRAEIMAKGLPSKRPIKNVKHIVLVSSGKGGVGKSTTAANLATALKVIAPTKNVGLLDADIFGPTIPLMMNLNDTPLLNDNNLMEPLTNYGVKCMSMGFLIDEGAPVIWRGLMVMQALEKLIRQVEWGPTDYLVVDTPPGTGDTHLSLVQNVPISGVVLITTPQTASLQVTKRGGVMFKKLDVPLIGIIENMSHAKCPSCSNIINLFGTGAQELANKLNCPVLEKLPLLEKISSCGDKGIPIVISDPDSDTAKLYRNVAENVIKFLEPQEEQKKTAKSK